MRLRATRRHVCVAVALACVVSTQACAQIGGGPIDGLVAQWASVELPLLGVANVSDVQREKIERLEQGYRDLIAREVGPIRDARLAASVGNWVDAHDISRAIERINRLRSQQLDAVPAILDSEQRARFDANRTAIANVMKRKASRLRLRDAAGPAAFVGIFDEGH